MVTEAPRLDNISDMPLPNPVPPPVTKAVFPSKVFAGNMGFETKKKYKIQH